ncbi:A24 family peptidase [Cupriavidus basilensis]
MSTASLLLSLTGPSTIALVLTAAALDLKHRRIPNWLTFGAWLLALPVQICIHGLSGGAFAWAGGWLTGFAILLPFYLLRGMAAGDVKLMAAVGAWLGVAMAFHIALATFVIGGVWALVVTIAHGRLGRLRRNLNLMLFGLGSTAPGNERHIGGIDSSHSVGTLPYGVAIAAGTIGMLFASV